MRVLCDVLVWGASKKVCTGSCTLHIWCVHDTQKRRVHDALAVWTSADGVHAAAAEGADVQQQCNGEAPEPLGESQPCPDGAALASYAAYGKSPQP